MNFYPEPLALLITSLQKLPGIGPKTAQRLSLHLLHSSSDDAEALVEAITEARKKIFLCSVCGNLTTVDPCPICQDERRDRSRICVIEWPRDLFAIEKTREFNGLYHVLHGVLSPMDGIGPDHLNISGLLNRFKNKQIVEVIMALNPSVEGEATSLYLSQLIKPLNIRVTRIAHGLPVGGELEFADIATLSRAFLGRSEF